MPAKPQSRPATQDELDWLRMGAVIGRIAMKANAAQLRALAQSSGDDQAVRYAMTLTAERLEAYEKGVGEVTQLVQLGVIMGSDAGHD